MSEISEKEVEAAARALRPDAFRELTPMDLRSDDYALTNRQRAQEAARRSAQAALEAAALARAEANAGEPVAWPSDGTCIRCGSAPRNASGLCATCADEDAERYENTHPAPQPSGPVEALPEDDEPKTWQELAEAAIADLRRYANDETPERRLVSAEAYEDRARILSALTAGKPEPVVPSGWPEAIEALEKLVELVSDEVLGPSVADEPDNESVGWGIDGKPLPMTFGHVREAQSAVSTLRAALPAAPTAGGGE